MPANAACRHLQPWPVAPLVPEFRRGSGSFGALQDNSTAALLRVTQRGDEVVSCINGVGVEGKPPDRQGKGNGARVEIVSHSSQLPGIALHTVVTQAQQD